MPGGPYRLRATTASVRWPTTSRPSRIQDRRASSRRRPVASATAVDRPPAGPGVSRTTRIASDRRAKAASRPSRSAIRAGLIRRGEPAAGQVQEEQVHRATGQERAGDGQTLVQRRRGDDDEPLEIDAAGDGLHRIEGAGEVQPGHHRALGLGLGGDPEGEGRPAAGAVAADGDTGRSRQAAGPQDRIERREPGVDDAVVVRARIVDAGAAVVTRRPRGVARWRATRRPAELPLPSEPGGSPWLPSRPGKGSPSDGHR